MSTTVQDRIKEVCIGPITEVNGGTLVTIETDMLKRGIPTIVAHLVQFNIQFNIDKKNSILTHLNTLTFS